MRNRWIEVESADRGGFQAYLATPPTGAGPGVLLIQEIFGVNDHIRTVADQYALDGYTVLAPDLFWRQERRFDVGYGESDAKRGFEHMRKLDVPLAVEDLAASARALRARAECKGPVSALGYCLGGLLAYLVAAHAAVDAAICYYGGGIADQLAITSRLRCPVLLHFGGRDSYIPPASVQAIEQALRGHSRARIHVYPGVEHGFNCWARASYNQQAAALARGRTLEFLSPL
jgi:carboxymethylenebutenolidase